MKSPNPGKPEGRPIWPGVRDEVQESPHYLSSTRSSHFHAAVSSLWASSSSLSSQGLLPDSYQRVGVGWRGSLGAIRTSGPAGCGRLPSSFQVALAEHTGSQHLRGGRSYRIIGLDIWLVEEGKSSPLRFLLETWGERAAQITNSELAQ